MSIFFDLLAVAFSVLLLAAAGRGLLGALRSPESRSPSLGLVAGLVALYLGASALQALDWPVNLATFMPGMVLLALWGLRHTPEARPWQFGTWGTGDYLVLLLLLASILATTFSAGPDVFALSFEPPGLVSKLFVFISLLRGRVSEPALLLSSTALLLAILLEARSLLSRTRWIQGGSVLLALLLVAPAWALRLTGTSDWLIALAIAAALPALIGDAPTREQDVRLGLAAALAAASSHEGLIAASLLILVYSVRRWWRTRPVAFQSLALALMPGLVVTLLWLPQSMHSFLSRFELPEMSLFGEWIGAVLAATWTHAWHGLVPLLFLLLVALLVRKSPHRWVAFFSALYLLVMVFLSWCSTDSISHQVAETFPRVIFHLVLTIVLAGILELDRWSEGRPYP